MEIEAYKAVFLTQTNSSSGSDTKCVLKLTTNDNNKERFMTAGRRGREEPGTLFMSKETTTMLRQSRFGNNIYLLYVFGLRNGGWTPFDGKWVV